MFEFLALAIVTLANLFRLAALLFPTLFLVKLKKAYNFTFCNVSAIFRNSLSKLSSDFLYCFVGKPGK